jgi:PAS domain S-box-containing protein
VKPFQDISIQNKLLVMALTNCGLVLLVAITALFSFQVWNFRSNFKDDAAVLASIIADNSAVALVDEDSQTAAEVINSLKAQPNLVAAYLVLPDGTLFAQFGKDPKLKSLSLFPAPRESIFVNGQLLYTHPVGLARKRVGTVYLQFDYSKTFSQLLGVYGLVILLIIIISVRLAVFLTKRMGRGITDPILALANTAKQIGDKQEYSERVTTVTSTRELGHLVRTFNEMLDHIESQDNALKKSRDAEIHESREKLRSLIHSIDGIVWESTPQKWFKFTFVSSQIKRILGYSPEGCLNQLGFWQQKLHVEDAARVLQTCEDMVAHRQSYNQEYRILAADGRWVWIRESVTVLVEHGQTVALRGIFQDVSEQNIAAEQLEALNRKLVETSRCVGMAEVATGVLHNVGNVLNSVSVSATLVNDRMRRSKAGNLRRAAAMLREKNGRLAEFLSNDPKGKMLPDYLCKVADELADEQDQAILEMGCVGQHIEHIKEIVAMQQTYAKVSGASENLSAAEMVDEAVQMNVAGFERHLIRVVRETEAGLPLICADRHKVLQILINLLRNAKDAMDKQGADDKKLVIRVMLISPEQVAIAISDSGIGIAPQNILKIFNHGFTTKEDGHGFGLHSGANAAKEMGGRLTAQSKGIGQGATFTLELPVAKSAKIEDTANAGTL